MQAISTRWHGIRFSERQAHGQVAYQLFFREPIDGMKIELNFAAEEARQAGRKPTMNAQGAADREERE